MSTEHELALFLWLHPLSAPTDSQEVTFQYRVQVRYPPFLSLQISKSLLPPVGLEVQACVELSALPPLPPLYLPPLSWPAELRPHWSMEALVACCDPVGVQ